jgi:hypothetical protein
MILHLGVEDIAYADGPQKTSDVAEILEEKFHVMQIYADQNEDRIAQFIEDGVAGALESVLAGAPINFDVFGSAIANIEDRFIEYIDGEEHGIKTKSKESPKAGARKKRQYKKVTNKTTFVDSGLYRNNFKAWVDNG